MSAAEPTLAWVQIGDLREEVRRLRDELAATQAALQDLMQMKPDAGLMVALRMALSECAELLRPYGNEEAEDGSADTIGMALHRAHSAMARARALPKDRGGDRPRQTPTVRVHLRQCAQCTSPLPEDVWPRPVHLQREFCNTACLEEFRRPLPGKPATYTIGSDSYAYTVLNVSASGRIVVVRPADSPTAEAVRAHRNAQGNYNMGRAGRLYVGAANAHRDPHF